MTIYIVKLSGEELCRVSGEGIELCKRVVQRGFEYVAEDDPRMLKLTRDGKTILVFYVSAAENVTVEMEDTCQKVISE